MVPPFVSQRDSQTLLHPTRAKGKHGGEPTAEAETWPAEAKVASLMSIGFSYTEAWHMSLRDYRRYVGIVSSWHVPDKDREDGVRLATNDDLVSLFG